MMSREDNPIVASEKNLAGYLVPALDMPASPLLLDGCKAAACAGWFMTAFVPIAGSLPDGLYGFLVGKISTRLNRG